MPPQRHRHEEAEDDDNDVELSKQQVTSHFVHLQTPRHEGSPPTTPPHVVELQVPTTSDTTKSQDGTCNSNGSSNALDAPQQTKKKKQQAQDEEKTTKGSFGDMYRYASPCDLWLLALGCVMTCANGVMFPCMALIFGDAIGSFVPFDQAKVNRAAMEYLLLALVLFVTDYVSYILFHFVAEKQMQQLRQQALKHMLFLDITWYDEHDALQLSSRLTGDTVKIKDGMGKKLGDSIRFSAQFFAGYAIGFAKGWDISLCMACVMPALALSLAFLVKILRSRSEWAQKIYAEAGAIAEETLGSMRTVASLNGEKRAMGKYNEKTVECEKENIKLARYVSVVFGVFLASIWLMYAVGLWYGGYKVANNKTDPSSVFSAFFGVLMGTFSLALISPNVTAVAQAMGAAAALNRILSTPSRIDAQQDDGIIPEDCKGEIEVRNVNFTYPTRPEAPILKNYSVKIESGQTVAFAGASGGGKSTLVSLLERFYDPQSGSILLDGRDINTLQVRWLRSQIGLVSQEPVLFASSIFQNIAAGRSDVTMDQVVEAAKLANAHNFIMSLPEQYETLVGEKGVSLSGGQKQRVAIARAIIRQPKILVLDEATSALDAESERIVQAALNDLMDKTNMTTLVIAHRLSTIRRADKIVVLQDGSVAEEGTHDELLAIDHGVYRKLYLLQEIPSKEEAEDAYENEASVDQPKSGTRILRQLSSVSNRRDNLHEAFAARDAEKIKNRISVLQIMAFSRPERKYFLIGMVGALVGGFSFPASAILISEVISDMTTKYADFQRSGQDHYLHELKHEVNWCGTAYLVGSVILGVFSAMQIYCFKYMAEKLTTRLRNINFAALCRQDIGFFDEKKNATGALTADLATNATKVALMSGDSQGRLVQAAFTFVAALVISFGLGSWLLSLIMLAAFPLLILGQVIRSSQVQKENSVADELAESGALASEALSNIRTVVSLGLENDLTDKFAESLVIPMKKGNKEAQINGLALGFSSFILFATYALCFWFGGVLVNRNDITFTQLMRSTMAIMLSVQGVGNAASWFSDSDKATQAGGAIVSLRDREPPIDSFDETGLIPDRVQGRIEFKDVKFQYPTRRDVTVLKHYNLTIEPGQTVAFCGPSGGGKSTVISLLERFYDPIEGQILLDGHDTKTLNLKWLRSQIGLVGQEPTLFIGTIADNIAYGLAERPSQQEIEEAARMANAHDFITAFPDGYETQVGMKGEQLSGGQKQRIAIARAILKNPEILLLDEATSALDSESERIVQEALDKVVALKKRTTIIIAHRLSTIQKADKICVVSGKRIAEQGTHVELMAMNGIYKRLVESAAH